MRNNDGCIYRFEPRTGKFERYVAYGFANPHGRVFDYWGNDIITDATGNKNYFGPAFSGHLDYPAKHPKHEAILEAPVASLPRHRHPDQPAFSRRVAGQFSQLNVIGFQGIYRVKVTEEGSGLKGETLEDLVKIRRSELPSHPPSSVAPDGALYFLDWAQADHRPHAASHPRSEPRQEHGRIYRITYEGRPLLKPAKIDGQPIATLLELLKEPEDDVRTRAKIELGKHDSAKVIAAVKKWVAQLDPKDTDYEHHMTEALWVHQWHNVVNEDLLKRMLRSPDHRARAAATRVLCYWRDRVTDPLALLKVQAKDEHPRVRLEAVRACSFFKTAKAAEVALAALEKEADPDKPDYYIKYCLDETMKALDKYLK